jgi:hypothetical protein
MQKVAGELPLYAVFHFCVRVVMAYRPIFGRIFLSISTVSRFLHQERSL